MNPGGDSRGPYWAGVRLKPSHSGGTPLELSGSTRGRLVSGRGGAPKSRAPFKRQGAGGTSSAGASQKTISFFTSGTRPLHSDPCRRSRAVPNCTERGARSKSTLWDAPVISIYNPKGGGSVYTQILCQFLRVQWGLLPSKNGQGFSCGHELNQTTRILERATAEVFVRRKRLSPSLRFPCWL